jgi:hypothetical protein
VSIEQWMRWDRSFALTRRLMLFFVCYLTWESYAWSSRLAEMSDRPGVDIAAMIAAVTAPVSALAVMVFKSYVESRAS